MINDEKIKLWGRLFFPHLEPDYQTRAVWDSLPETMKRPAQLGRSNADRRRLRQTRLPLPGV